MKFNKVEWMNGANIYEVNTRQYTHEGTFNAFSQHLPRLNDMGVKILWFMPVTPISFSKRLGLLGSYYACSSYVKTNPEFGTIEDFKNLVDEAHRRGMKVIIDWVANHTGYDHEWALKNKDWYVLDDKGNFTEENGWEDVIDLNYNSADMRKAMISAMQFWIKECDIDGFRCDMAHLVPLDFWREARQQCDALKPLFWLAECEEPLYLEVFDASYPWEWMHATENMLKQSDGIYRMTTVLDRYKKMYPAGSKKIFYTANHDENSWNGTEYDKYGSAAKTFAVFSCTWPKGIPLIYSGQEIPNFRKLKFFEKDHLEWPAVPLLQGFYQSLLSMRNNNKAFHDGANFTLLSNGQDDKVMSYFLQQGQDKAIVLLNFSNSDRMKLNITDKNIAGVYYNIFNGIEHNLDDTSADFELQAFEFAVYSTVPPVS